MPLSIPVDRAHADAGKPFLAPLRRLHQLPAELAWRTDGGYAASPALAVGGDDVGEAARAGILCLRAGTLAGGTCQRVTLSRHPCSSAGTSGVDSLRMGGFEISGTELMVGMITSTIGMGIFIYGKKSDRFPQIFAGLALMAFPMAEHATIPVLAVSTLIVAALWLGVRLGL